MFVTCLNSPPSPRIFGVKYASRFVFLQFCFVVLQFLNRDLFLLTVLNDEFHIPFCPFYGLLCQNCLDIFLAYNNTRCVCYQLVLFTFSTFSKNLLTNMRIILCFLAMFWFLSALNSFTLSSESCVDSRMFVFFCKCLPY